MQSERSFIMQRTMKKNTRKRCSHKKQFQYKKLKLIYQTIRRQSTEVRSSKKTCYVERARVTEWYTAALRTFEADDRSLVNRSFSRRIVPATIGTRAHPRTTTKAPIRYLGPTAPTRIVSSLIFNTCVCLRLFWRTNKDRHMI